jgi:hypothetical protein
VNEKIFNHYKDKQEMNYKDIPHALVKETFSYNEATGDLSYKKDVSKKFKAGQPAGYKANFKSGSKVYIFVKVPGYNAVVLAHRLIWFLVTGEWPDCIDHIDRDGCNNRFRNLRNVSRTENQRNRRIPKNNTSGVCGVTFNVKAQKWLATIRGNNSTVYLGAFENIEDAKLARKSAEKEYGYHYQHGNVMPVPSVIFN